MTPAQEKSERELLARCVAFVTEQACGEWDDSTIFKDAVKLQNFVLSEISAAGDAPAWPAEVSNLLPSSEWTSKRYEFQTWTGSAFLAGEPVDDERACRQDLYSFLCGLFGYICAAEEAAQACEAISRPDRGGAA